MKRFTFWFVLLFAIFAIAYTLTDLTVKYVMADFVPPTNTGYTTLEVKENTGKQTDQYTPIQPSVTPVGKEF